MSYAYRPHPVLVDPLQAGWVHLLRPVAGRRVLRLGPERPQVDATLLAQGCAGLTVLGPAPGHAPPPEGVRLVDRLEAVEDGSCGLVIVEALPPPSRGPAGRPPGAGPGISGLARKLRDDGELLLCLPPCRRFPDIGARWRLLRVLRPFPRRRRAWYACLPDAAFPEVITGCATRPGAALRALRRMDGQTRAPPLRRVRRAAASLRTLVRPPWNPWMGGLAVVRAPGDGTPPAASAVGRALAAAGRAGEAPAYALLAKRYVPKQNVLIFDLDRDACVAVGKIGNRRLPRGDAVARERAVLQALQRHGARLRDAGIRVPALLYHHRDRHTELSVERTLPGTPLSAVARDALLEGRPEELTRILSRLLEKRLRLHDVLSALGDAVPALDDARFGTGGLPLPPEAAALPPAHDLRNIEHGDFTDVNILLGPGDGGDVGLIDWEWTARGYPPGFDMFSLVESIGYVEDPGRREEEFSRYRRSFLDTFFRENAFSGTVRELLARYHRERGLPPGDVRRHFVRYLVLVHNKYRLYYNLPEFQELYAWKIRRCMEEPEGLPA